MIIYLLVCYKSPKPAIFEGHIVDGSEIQLAITLVQITTNIPPPSPGFTPQSIPIMRHFLGAYEIDEMLQGHFKASLGAGIWAFGTCQTKILSDLPRFAKLTSLVNK